MAASANWFSPMGGSASSTASDSTATSAKETAYSSPPVDDGVFVTCTPSAFGETTTTPLSAVTSSQSACSA
jgi:hypothetical protein